MTGVRRVLFRSTELDLEAWDAVWQRFYDRGVQLGMSPNEGYCPLGCGESLRLADTGRVVCLHPRCPRPYAVAEILEDHETEHEVTFGDTSFTVRHPLRERLDDALMQCPLGEHLASFDAPPVSPGRYRAVLVAEQEWVGQDWAFEPLEVSS